MSQLWMLISKDKWDKHYVGYQIYDEVEIEKINYVTYLNFLICYKMNGVNFYIRRSIAKLNGSKVRLLFRN